MKKKILCILTLALAGTGAAFAQDYYVGGKLMYTPYFKATDMLSMSQYDYSFGTARSAAMGGAFTSLGADLSSVNINPAGLGMYRGNEVGFTPSITVSDTKSSNPASPHYSLDDKYNRFAPNNAGFALNIFEGSGALTSVTLAFSYNKLADFNNRTGVGTDNTTASILDVHAMEMRGIDPSEISANSNRNPYSRYEEYLWGGIAAFRTDVLSSYQSGGTNMYRLNPANFAQIDEIAHFLNTNTRGSVGEYGLGVGMNFSNQFYLGFTLGLQDIYYSKTESYSEDFIGDADLDFIIYDQHVKMSGSAVNFKAGVTWRPFPELRIGAAVHTPSYVSLNRQYGASYYTQYATNWKASNTDVLIRDYNFTTPARLLTGISYTFADIGIISVDYERVWYNGMRLKDDYEDVNDSFKAEIKDIFRGANNLRVGLEVMPVPMLALRAGYANYGRSISDKNRMFWEPVTYASENFSGGVGLRVRNFNLDFAYVNTKYKTSTYGKIFEYEGPDNDGNDTLITHDGQITTKQKRNTCILSLGLRF